MSEDMVVDKKVEVSRNHMIGNYWAHMIPISTLVSQTMISPCMRFIEIIQKQRRQDCFIALCFSLLWTFLTYMILAVVIPAT